MFQIQQSASEIGQRQDFTIAACSASADSENCSFGHCLSSIRVIRSPCFSNAFEIDLQLKPTHTVFFTIMNTKRKGQKTSFEAL